MPDDAARALTERYDREARDYRDLWAPVLRTAGRELARELAGGEVHRVLDVGAGVGALLPDLCATFPGAFVLGVDRSRGMLALAPGGIARAVMDATRLALAPASLDRVFMVFMLFHLENPLAGLSEARRVMRAGGRAGTLTWAGELESSATRIWSECLDEHGAAAAEPASQARHEAVDGPEKMEALLRDAGFTAARAWAAELVFAIGAEHLIKLRTRLGSLKPRFESLGPAARDACVADARRRMSSLEEDGFLARASVVCSVARA